MNLRAVVVLFYGSLRRLFKLKERRVDYREIALVFLSVSFRLRGLAANPITGLIIALCPTSPKFAFYYALFQSQRYIKPFFKSYSPQGNKCPKGLEQLSVEPFA